MQSLDDAYANGPYIPDAAGFEERWAARAQAFRKTWQQMGLAELDISYGPSARQVYDFFSPIGPSKNVMIFVHGGYWMKFDKSIWSHLAKGALDKGWHVALPSYDLCTSVKIGDITRQITQAVIKVGLRTTGKIALTGHSAGGHLVARVVVGKLLPSKIYRRINRVIPISPIGDLRPLRHTQMNKAFRLSEADAIAESPMLMEKPACPITIWVGADERPAFVNQARWLANAWRAEVVTEVSRHHFDVIESLENSKSKLIEELLSF